MLGQLPLLLGQASERALSRIDGTQQLTCGRILLGCFSSSLGCRLGSALLGRRLLDASTLGIVVGVHGGGLRLSAIAPGSVPRLHSSIEALRTGCRSILGRLLLQRGRHHGPDASRLLIGGLADAAQLTASLFGLIAHRLHGFAHLVESSFALGEIGA
ncbi:hypothetical protein LT17_05567 [Pseudomonas aeruginosa]|nr:hypothetical protein LT17_05567 [Pseudomonas aeruginosa]